MTYELWLLFLITCISVSLSPGPNAMMALSLAIRNGRHTAYWFIAGSVVGFTLLVLIVLLGVAEVLIEYPLAMNITKIGGGVFLLWLAFKMWVVKPAVMSDKPSYPPKRDYNVFINGFLLAISNPKVLLFWLTVLPRFIDFTEISVPDILLVTVTFALIEGTAELIIVVIGAASASFLHKWIKYIERGAALFFCGMALFVLFG